MPWSKEQRRKYNSRYRVENKTRLQAKRRQYYLSHKSEVTAYNKRWQEANRERVRARGRVYYLRNRSKIAVRAAAHRRANRAAHLARHRRYYAEHKAEARQYAARRLSSRRARDQKRRKSELGFRIQASLRARVWKVARGVGGKKAARTKQLLGCETTQFLERLQRQFLPGMSWQNYGLHGWHIDHIIPCEAFDFTCIEAQCACFHYTNLRPFWAADNIKRPRWVGPKLSAAQIFVLSQKQANTKLTDLGIFEADCLLTV